MIRVLHVVATAQRRGAEVFAADLVGALAGEAEQAVAILRRTEGAGVSFAAPTFVLHGGFRAPGLRVRPRGVRELSNLIDRWGADVVQAHGGEPFKYAILAARRGPPVVYRRIGTAPQAIRRGPRRLGHGALMKRAAAIAAVSESIRRETIDVFRVPPNRVRTIPSAADPKRLRPLAGRTAVRHSLQVPADGLMLLSVAALSSEKDPVALLEVLARVRAERSDAHLVAAGDGPLRSAVEAAAAARGVAPAVRLLGSRADVPDLLAAGDVMVLTSRSEGMPACLVEAGIAGLPVVAFDVGGVAEAVVHGETGYLAPAGDVAALSSLVLTLAADAGARRSMGRAARDRCLARFSIEAVAPAYLELFDRLSRLPTGNR